MRSAGLLLFLVCQLPACSDNGEAAEPTRRGRNESSSGGTVALGLRDLDYRPMAVGTSGSITGRIVLARADSVTADSVRVDSISAVQQSQPSCADTAGVASAAPANALVWIDGITSGKPLPEVRRDAITIEQCRFTPRVMGVVAGTTINVKSRDKAILTSRFFHEGAGEPIAEIHTVDAGQVVPSEKIASKPGIVEIRTAQQQGSRGFIAVFDHPYFTVTDARGVFTFDSLPAGTYTVKVWHESMSQPMEQRVVVGPGGKGQLEFTLSLDGDQATSRSTTMAANNSAR